MDPSERQLLINEFGEKITPTILQAINKGHKGISIRLNSTMIINLTCRTSDSSNLIRYSFKKSFDEESEYFENITRNRNHHQGIKQLLEIINKGEFDYEYF